MVKGADEETDRQDGPARVTFDRIIEALREEGFDFSDPAVREKVMELARLLATSQST